jgi:hypothetical protein
MQNKKSYAKTYGSTAIIATKLILKFSEMMGLVTRSPS